MPPVMGAAAFVMAEMIAAPYWQIVLAAILPAILYYAAAAIQVYLRADRLGLKGIPREELPRLKTNLATGWYLLIPLAALIYMLMALRFSPTRAGIWSLILMVVVNSIQYLLKERRFPWREILEALESGGRTLVVVASACGAAGIIIGVVSLTAIGVRSSQLVIDLAGGMLPLTLLYTMLACIVLGMGLPTTAAYIITAVLAAPALVGDRPGRPCAGRDDGPLPAALRAPRRRAAGHCQTDGGRSVGRGLAVHNSGNGRGQAGLADG